MAGYLRDFDWSIPLTLGNQKFPTTTMGIEEPDGTVKKRQVFVDSKGNYYGVENGMPIPVMMQHNLDEVVVTPSKEVKRGLLSEAFNKYLTMSNDATYISRPKIYRSISPDLSFNAVQKRATRAYSNYSDALDFPFSNTKEFLVNKARWIKDNYIEDFPTGASNCTLSATQWVNPANPINRASSIVNKPRKYRYARIDSINANPGDLLIAKVPNKDSYHTMLITGIAKGDKDYTFRGKTYKAKEGEPLLTYSRGGNSLDNIQSNIPLSVYTAHSDGHTENMFFRYIKPERVSLFK